MDSEILASYWTKGWVVINDVFSESEMDAIVDIAMDVSQKGLAANEEDFPPDISPNGEILPRKINRAYLKHAVFKAFVTDARLKENLAALLGDLPLLVTDQIFMKPPHFGSAKPYHQDNYYFQCRPVDKVITAWVALDDADVENGCMRYIDGSHKGEMLPHDPVPDADHTFAPPARLLDLNKESIANVRKGGVLFHHAMVLHTSHGNESDCWRRGYASHWLTSEVVSNNETLDQSYFKMEREGRSGGADESFCNYMVSQ